MTQKNISPLGAFDCVEGFAVQMVAEDSSLGMTTKQEERKND